MHKFSWMLAGLIGAAAMTAQAPAYAKVVELESNAFVTRDSKTVAADERAVWLALTTPGDWWNKAHTFSGDPANMMLTPQAGGCFCERIPEKDTSKVIGMSGSVQHMSVILAIPDQALRLQGALGPLQSEPVDGVLTITLAKADEGTKVTFEYAVGGYMRFEVPVIAKAVDGVMSLQLAGLAELLGEVDAADKAPAKEDAEADPDSDGESAEEGEEGEESGGGDDADEADTEDKSDEKIEPKISVDEAFGDLVVDQ